MGEQRDPCIFHIIAAGNILLETIPTKGQLISEAIFLALNSSKKRTQYLKFFALATRAEVFRSFFGRIEIKIICF